ncbi:RICIN domain-containing protein [Paenibacillus pasadenensis]|uniref:RICIN domain-containing protein n=1 Tax=Paenibacillus pasadenensis TaxID=217090 RepID=UPI00203CAB0C|nr:RICIN domain-containing protein [Paenibacillus pasadenensis]MCM3747768.1 RICIN domain-containing protein [Paenibacillus pasadenensis]
MAALIALSSMLLLAQPAHAASGLIVNNADRFDTGSNPIWAQGGWIMQEGSMFYWYGMDYSVPNRKKVNVYTSTDFVNWTSHQAIVDFTSINAKLDADGNTTTGRFADTQWIGRPLVKYNAVQNKYVMLAEWGGNGDGDRNKITIFTSASATGPFTYEKYISKPAGWGMGDLGSILTDDDGSTYITYSDDNNGDTNSAIRISKLAADFMSISQHVYMIPHNFIPTNAPKKEASALFKKGSKYILLASRTNGWTATESYCYSASSLSGPWSGGNGCATNPNSNDSFDNQVDQVLPIQGAQGTVYMFIGDRWNNMKNNQGQPASNQAGRNNWYPLTFDSNDNPTINGHVQWFLDPVNGTWSAPPAASPLQSYALVNGNSGKAMGIAANSLTDGATAEQRSYTGGISQYWKLIDAGSGYYKIQNTNSGLYLDMTNASTANGENAIQTAASAAASQQWQLVDAGGGYFKLKNRNSGKVLCLGAGSTADGALVMQWAETGTTNQTWRFDKVIQLDLSKTYSIKNSNSGKALGTVGGAAANGTTIEQRTFNGAASQSWQFEYSNGFYRIKHVNSGMYMDISGASAANGANSVIGTSTASSSQQWQLVDAGGGYFKLKNVNSGKVLGIGAGSTDDGAAGIQWTDFNVADQKWSFTVLNP